MKKLLAIIAGLASAFSSLGADVQFYFSDFTLTPETNRTMSLFPINISGTNANFLIGLDRIRRTFDTNGSAIISNVPSGDYRGEFAGTYTLTTHFFTFPTTNGFVNAKNYRGAATNVPGATVAYTMVQSDGRYLSISTNGMNTNTGAFLKNNGTNDFWSFNGSSLTNLQVSGIAANSGTLDPSLMPDPWPNSLTSASIISGLGYVPATNTFGLVAGELDLFDANTNRQFKVNATNGFDVGVNTYFNSSTTMPGFMPKLDGNSAHFFNGAGQQVAIPPSGLQTTNGMSTNAGAVVFTDGSTNYYGYSFQSNMTFKANQTNAAVVEVQSSGTLNISGGLSITNDLGQAGQVLTTTGTRPNPYWAAPPSGGGSMFYRSVSIVNDQGSTTESNVVSFSITGGTLGTNKRMRISILGDLIQNSGSNTNITIKCIYGATTLWNSGTTSITGRNVREPFVIYLDLTAANSATAQTLVGKIDISNSGSSPTTGEGNMGVASTQNAILLGTATENSASTLTFILSTTWASASSLCEFKVQYVDALVY